MKINKNNPPRKFTVGTDKKITISDCANINLKHNEQVSFITHDNKEYDVVRKEWGFYATPSMNGRLKNQGFKTALVKNKEGMYYIMIVEKNKTTLFEKITKNVSNKNVKTIKDTLDNLLNSTRVKSTAYNPPKKSRKFF